MAPSRPGFPMPGESAPPSTEFLNCKVGHCGIGGLRPAFRPHVMDADQLFALCFAPDPEKLFNDAKPLLRSFATWERGLLLLKSAAEGGSHMAAVWLCVMTLPPPETSQAILAAAIDAGHAIALAFVVIFTGCDALTPAALNARHDHPVADALLDCWGVGGQLPVWTAMRALGVDDPLAATFAMDQPSLFLTDPALALSFAERGAAAGFLPAMCVAGRIMLTRAHVEHTGAAADVIYQRGLRIIRFAAKHHPHPAFVLALELFASPRGDWAQGLFARAHSDALSH